jgi:flagellin-like hook-associated protein FlgL
LIFQGANPIFNVGSLSKSLFIQAAQEYGEKNFQDDMIFMTSDGSYGVVSGTQVWDSLESAGSAASHLASVYGGKASDAWSALLASAIVSGTTAGGFGSDVTITAPSVDDYDSANATLNAVQDAINRVSTQRSALGALQNRLEHTIANLDNVAENTQAAESRIRDTDMASEMVEYSKNNILAQAGQSMLAQANQSTQGILSLLQ